VVEAAANVRTKRVTGSAGEWTCALIRCGTSRAIVVRADQLPQDEEQRAAVLRQRMGGSMLGGGLAGAHYQQNKVAVVAPGPHRSTFRFQFFQFHEGSGELTLNLECANVAAAAALFGLLEGLVEFDGTGGVQGLNEGTGQWVSFELERSAEPWNTICRVRFGYSDGLSVPIFSGFQPLQPLAPALPVDVWVAQHGNLFVLADIEPAAAAPDLLDTLSTVGSDIAVRLGADPLRAANPKVLAYRLDSVGECSIQAHATCFYRGEMHASLPGSGAMFLAAFLVRRLADETRVGFQTSAVAVHLAHPSGILPVRVELEAGSGGLRVTATEFCTPVELLMWGVGPPDVVRT